MYLLTASLILLSSQFMAQECPQDFSKPQFHFPRIFILKGFDSGALQSNETVAAKNLGTCRTTREHAEGMIKYVKKFGIDLSGIRDPYEAIDDDRYSITPYVRDPKGFYRMVMTSFYEYGRVAYANLTFSSWAIVSKTELNGPEKTLPAGNWALYGVFR